MVWDHAKACCGVASAGVKAVSMRSFRQPLATITRAECLLMKCGRHKCSGEYKPVLCNSRSRRANPVNGRVYAGKYHRK